MNHLNLLLAYNHHTANQRIMDMKLSKICESIRSNFYKENFHINVISSAARGKLKETAHSMILHDLLHHPILLSSFLEEIVGISGDTFSKDDIRYPDQDRIDLSLVSHKKNKFLIIENKVNAAEEQPGQIYRYVNLALKQVSSMRDVTVLYLNPDNGDPPSLYSRSKDGIGKETDNETVPSEMITIKNYKYDILKWLKSKEREIGINEIQLKSSLLQYIDYLEEYFQIKDKFKKLRDMTQKEIIKMLDLEKQPLSDCLDTLSSKIRELDHLRSELDRTRKLFEFKKIEEQVNNSYKGRVHFKIFSTDVPELGFDAIFENILFRVSIVLWTNNTYYWRIYGDGDKPLNSTIKDHINELLQPFFPDMKQSQKNWDFYQTISKEFCSSRLIELTEIFEKDNDIQILS